MSMIVVTELAMNLGVFVACIPFIKPFVHDVQSGVLRVKGSNGASLDTTTEHALHTVSTRTQHGRRSPLHMNPESSKTQTTVTSRDRHDQGPNSRRSSFGSNEMIIKQTRAFVVHTDRD